MNEHREREDSYDCFIFCRNHKQDGIETLQQLGAAGLDPVPENEYHRLMKKKKIRDLTLLNRPAKHKRNIKKYNMYAPSADDDLLIEN